MTIVKNIVTTLIGLALLIVLPFVIFTYVTSKSPVLFDFRSYIVLTGSMEPELPVGSMVYTQPKPSYAVGDVITFTDKEDRTVTHRITAVKGDSYETRGDANTKEDSDLVPKEKVVGSVFLHVPYIGKYIDFLKTPQNFILFIVLPALVFIGIEFWNIRNEIVKETEKRVLKKLEQQQA
jgi:signal peptidase I